MIKKRLDESNLSFKYFGEQLKSVFFFYTKEVTVFFTTKNSVILNWRINALGILSLICEVTEVLTANIYIITNFQTIVNS